MFRPGAKTAGDVGKAMIADAGNAQRALRTALAVYLQGGPDNPDYQEQCARDLLGQRIDQDLFFEHFWAIAAAEDTAERQEAFRCWKKELGGLTREVFAAETTALAPPAARVERTRARAELMLMTLLKKHGLRRPDAAEPEEDAA